MTVDVNLTTAMMLVLGIAGVEALRLFVAFAFRRFTTDPGFVTIKHCETCENGTNDEIVVIKEILLVIAVKTGVPEEDLRSLVRRDRP